MNTENINIGKDCEMIIQDYIQQINFSQKFNKVIADINKIDYNHNLGTTLKTEYYIFKEQKGVFSEGFQYIRYYTTFSGYLERFAINPEQNIDGRHSILLD